MVVEVGKPPSLTLLNIICTLAMHCQIRQLEKFMELQRQEALILKDPELPLTV